MANTETNTINTNKRFLDYGGLETFWKIITGRFADKTAAVHDLSLRTSDNGETHTIVGTMIDATGAATSVELPKASRDQAGLMSKDHFALIDDLNANIEEMAPFAGLQIGDSVTKNEVSLSGRKATIGLDYTTELVTTENGTTQKAYISLIDPNYPTEGRWVEVSELKYNSTSDSTSKSFIKDGNTITYYVWTKSATEVPNEDVVPASNGPVNALDEPILSRPISRIDVTQLLKTGLLQSSNVVINPSGKDAGTYLELVFNVADDDTGNTTDTVYINVTDLVDVYTAGEGISITPVSGEAANDDARTGSISINAAATNSLGGIKIGYTVPTNGNAKTYAVQLDATNKAYVAVPWDETEVVISTPEANIDGDNPIYAVDQTGKPYLIITDNSSKLYDETDGSYTNKFNFQISVGEGIKNAEALARTAVQSVVAKPETSYPTGDTQAPGTDYLVITSTDKGGFGQDVVVDLTKEAKESLKLADEAVQEISVVQCLPAERPKAAEGTTNDINIVLDNGSDAKGEKSYTVSLGDRTIASLNLADTAIQELTILGKTINQTTPVITADEATLAMSLGSAANVDITDDGEFKAASLKSNVAGPTGDEERKTVATAEAVKTYVDATAGTITSEYETYVNNAIDGLDSKADSYTESAGNTAQESEAQLFYTKIVINDGKLVGPDTDVSDTTKYPNGKSEISALKITDITDFRELTDDEIYILCTGNPKPAETPEQ